MKEYKVLVTGATGFVGRHVVRELMNMRYSVVALVRSPQSEVAHLGDSRVTKVMGDLRDYQALKRATTRVDAVIHAAALTSEKVADYQLSYEVNVGGARNIVGACKENGVERVVVLSTRSVKKKHQGVYGKTKAEAERVFLDCGLDFTIYRPSLIYGRGSKGVFSKIIKLVESLPVVPVVGDGKYKNRPIFVEDVAKLLARTVFDERTYGKIYDLVGRDEVSFNQMIDEILRVMGRRKPKIHIPYMVCYALAWGFSKVSQNPPITRDTIIGVTQETEMDLSLIEKLGFSPLSFEEGIKRVFSEKKG